MKKHLTTSDQHFFGLHFLAIENACCSLCIVVLKVHVEWSVRFSHITWFSLHCVVFTFMIFALSSQIFWCHLLCRKGVTRRILKKNPLKNKRVMIRLNPYAKAAAKAARAVEQSRLRQKEALLNKKRGVSSSPLSIWIIKKKSVIPWQSTVWYCWHFQLSF